ncbi:hypothetical protein [Verrucomicrobium spinosum]|uniref:hypothetical protein n=1 Tax=Verrucomicrobium spinosum TaxID=2736 RepID=UPI001C46F1CC|nr:hypothetical protein [Verrucomicrobium spinosum]
MDAVVGNNSVAVKELPEGLAEIGVMKLEASASSLAGAPRRPVRARTGSVRRNQQPSGTSKEGSAATTAGAAPGAAPA